jgi:hypothetical protein
MWSAYGIEAQRILDQNLLCLKNFTVLLLCDGIMFYYIMLTDHKSPKVVAIVIKPEKS